MIAGGGDIRVRVGRNALTLKVFHRARLKSIAHISYRDQYCVSSAKRELRCLYTSKARKERLYRIARRRFGRHGPAFKRKFLTLIKRDRTLKKLFSDNDLRFSRRNQIILFNKYFKKVMASLPRRKSTGKRDTYTVRGGGSSGGAPGVNDASILTLKKVRLSRKEKAVIKSALSKAASKVYGSRNWKKFKGLNWDLVDQKAKKILIKEFTRRERKLTKRFRVFKSGPAVRKDMAASILYVSYRPLGAAFKTIRKPQPNMPRSPKLTRGLFINIGTALKKTLKARGTLRGYKSIRTLAIAVKGKKLRWRNKLNHPTHLKFLYYLNKVMTNATKPNSNRMFPVKWSTSQSYQRIYASWLLYRYVDHLTRKRPPRLKRSHLKRIGKALKKTMRRYRRTLGHNAMIPLTCALQTSYYRYKKDQESERKPELRKWYKMWLPRSSQTLKHFVKSLNVTMPTKFKPKYMYPVSDGYRQGYAKWLLVQYVRSVKLKGPRRVRVRLNAKQRRLYLEHAVLPAVQKAVSASITKPVKARRHLIWNKYKNYRKLPVGLDVKFSRAIDELLKRRAFTKIRLQIAAGKRKYCPSGSGEILAKMYRQAVWNARAIADAKQAKPSSAMGGLGAAVGSARPVAKRPTSAKAAKVEIVPLNPQQKKLILAAIFKAVNEWRVLLRKPRFRSASQARLYLRKNALIWSRTRLKGALQSTLNSKLTAELAILLRGTKLGKLYTQLHKIGRSSPKMLYHSAVFDTNAGYITVAKRTLPGTRKPPARQTVTLKSLQLSQREVVAAKGKLLGAWQAIRMHHTLPNFNTSSELAAYLKANDKNLGAGVKEDLIPVFKNWLNSKSNPVPTSIQPKVKSPTKQEEFTQRVYIAILTAAKAVPSRTSAMGGLGAAVGSVRPAPRRVAPRPAPQPRPMSKRPSAMGGLGAAIGSPRPAAKPPVKKFASIILNQKQMKAGKRALWLASKRLFPAYFNRSRRNDAKVAAHLRTYLTRKGGWNGVPRWVKNMVRKYLNREWRLGKARPNKVHRWSAVKQRAYTGRMIQTIVKKQLDSLGGLLSAPRPEARRKSARRTPRSAMDGLKAALPVSLRTAATTTSGRRLPKPPKGSPLALSSSAEELMHLKTTRNDGNTCRFTAMLDFYTGRGEVCLRAQAFDKQLAEIRDKYARFVYKHMSEFKRRGSKRSGKQRCSYRATSKGRTLFDIKGYDKAACQVLGLALAFSKTRNIRLAHAYSQKVKYLMRALKLQAGAVFLLKPTLIDRIWMPHLNPDGTRKI